MRLQLKSVVKEHLLEMDVAVLSMIAIYLMLIAIYYLLYQCSCIGDQRTIHPEELSMVSVVHQEQGQIQEV